MRFGIQLKHHCLLLFYLRAIFRFVYGIIFPVMNMKINEIIVVEGKDDTQRVKRAVTCETIETNGSAINQSTLDAIKHAHEKRGVIVLTDPDFPGDKIRQTITNYVPTVKHAFIERHVAKDKRSKIGVEHASLETIREALKNVSTQKRNQEELISKALLIDLGLILGEDAKYKREQLSQTLNIGHCNGKQLYQRLNAFGISQDELLQAMNRGDSNGV